MVGTTEQKHGLGDEWTLLVLQNLHMDTVKDFSERGVGIKELGSINAWKNAWKGKCITAFPIYTGCFLYMKHSYFLFSNELWYLEDKISKFLVGRDSEWVENSKAEIKVGIKRCSKVPSKTLKIICQGI